MTKPLKSVHITNYYHKNSGGISTAYNKLLEAANRNQRYVRLIVPGTHNDIEEVGEFGRIYYIKAEPFFGLFDKRYRVMLPWNSYLLTGTPMRLVLHKEKPDIVEIGEKYSNSLFAGLMRKNKFFMLKRPLLIHFTCERMDDNISSFISGALPFMWFARRVMGNYIFPMFDFHIANSEYTAQEILDAVWSPKNPKRSHKFFNFCYKFFHAARTPINSRVFVNFCGVDNETFSRSRCNEETRKAIFREYDLPLNAKIILYAGRVSPEKNVILLPKMMEILSTDSETDYRLLIAGAGPQISELKQLADKLPKDKIKFLGHLNGKERLADLYANVDVFVHPNPKEPFGIAPLEAMASGIPVVAPNSGGLLSYACDENAWLTKPKPEFFAAAIKDVFSDEKRRKFKVNNAFETAQKYTWEDSTNRLFKLYDEMHAAFTANQHLFHHDQPPSEIDYAKELLVNSAKNEINFNVEKLRDATE